VNPEAAGVAHKDQNDERQQAAEASRQRALAFYDAGDYRAARLEFLRAADLLPSFRLFYNLGVVSLALDDAAAAFSYFERYLSEGGAAVPAAARETVTHQLRQLSGRVASVSVRVDIESALVEVDGTTFGPTPLAGPLHLNPGHHRIVVTAPDSRTVSRDVALAAGASVELELRLSPPPTQPVTRKQPSPLPKLNQRRNDASWLGWTVTGTLASAALLSGWQALSAQSAYEKAYSGISSRDELDRADAKARHWSLAADVLGGAALVAGAYSLYSTLSPRPGGNGGEARRVSISVAPRGAQVVVRY
jgi:hypothetical protein